MATRLKPEARATVLARMMERIASGETLVSVCKTKGFPAVPTFFRWVEEDPKLREQYTRARSKQADVFAEMIVEQALSAKDAQLGRLRMDALKWATSKIAPKKYGERVELEHSGDQPAIVVKIGDMVVPQGRPPGDG
jgi:hypothetical protein